MYFNPRPREEGDGNLIDKYSIYFDISIHALVKRATYGRKWYYRLIDDFNPRPREEGDRITAKGFYQRCNFNPRPREEGDRIQVGSYLAISIFQSTPS